MVRPQSNRDRVKPDTQGPLVGHTLESWWGQDIDFNSFLKEACLAPDLLRPQGLAQLTFSGVLLSGRYSHLGVSSEVGMNEHIDFSGFFKKVFREWFVAKLEYPY